MKEIDFSNSTVVNEYFDKVLESLRGVKIRSIFSLDSCYGYRQNYREYFLCEDIYILFENDKCLAISYLFIDSLYVSLHEQTEEEQTLHNQATMKDFFNDSANVYIESGKYRNETISLEYDSLVGVSLEKVTYPYGKWIDGDLEDEVQPKDTTFCKITFKMVNGKSFSLEPASAELDGYTYMWSEDAKEVFTYHE